MARKRARTEDGHFVADDPSTPENEAWTEDKSQRREAASKKAKAKKAPAPQSAFTMFVSSSPETSVYDLRVGEARVRGIWDGSRQHVSWRVPSDLTEALMKHHMVWSGRVINAEED